jgi:ABC-2 type transport system ATP-binding protein
MDEIDEFCDRLALIDHGRIVVTGTPAELKARVGPRATLDDVFIQLASTSSQFEGNYGDVRRARQAISEHG